MPDNRLDAKPSLSVSLDAIKQDTALTRHFTATGFVVHRDATLLHWHRRVQAWIPPGGHIEPNEDPVQAVLREILEETGLDVQIVPDNPLPKISNLQQLHPPRTILVEDVHDEKAGKHQHIDLIYFTTVSELNTESEYDTSHQYPEVPQGWGWVSKHQLESCQKLTTPNGDKQQPPEDVTVLALMAIDECGSTLAR